MFRLALFAAALALCGCATTYQLSVMPRDSGRIYGGSAEEGLSGEGRISITIEDKAYAGTWVQMAPGQANAWLSGGLGWGYGRRGFGALGTMVTLDEPQAPEAKALLTAADGSGLRCDLRVRQGRGGGVCRDDKGREYDVQLRPARKD